MLHETSVMDDNTAYDRDIRLLLNPYQVDAMKKICDRFTRKQVAHLLECSYTLIGAYINGYAKMRMGDYKKVIETFGKESEVHENAYFFG